MSTLTTFTSGAFHCMLQVSWQAAVLAAMVLIVQIIFRKKLSPAWRYGLWLLVVARLLTPISPQSAVSVFNLVKLAARPSPAPLSAGLPVNPPRAAPDETQPPAGTLVEGNSGSPPMQANRVSSTQPNFAQATKAVFPLQIKERPPTNWFVIAGRIWMAGVCLLGMRLFWANIRFRSCLQRQVPVSDAVANQLLRECAGILGVRQRVVLIETERVESPAVWGLLRKRLLLPTGAFKRFSAAELRHIFLHELAHIKRCDLEVNCLVGVLQVLHWFNPLLWLAFVRMRADRELATDALALSRAHRAEAVGYGETILKVLEGLAAASQPGLVGIAESKARMKERLFAIVNRDSARPWRWAAVVVALVLAGIGLTSARQASEPSVAPQSSSTKPNFAIRILDYDSGKPLSGVTVKFALDYFGGNSKKPEALTDNEGRASLEFSTVELKHLAYEARKTNYLTLRGDWFNQQLSALPAEYEVKLPHGVEIGGRVTDENGNAIAGAQISWDEPVNMILSASFTVSADNAQIWTVDSGEPIASTDSTGHWKAKCVWPTVQWVSFRIHHPDFADATGSTEISSAMEAEGRGKKVNFDDLIHGGVMMKLAGGVTVNGRVINEAGEPMPGIEVNYAELLVLQHAISDRLLGRRSAMTDAAGKFRFDHAPPKHLYFKVQTAGYAPAVAELTPKSSNAEIELRLVKGRRFVGQIVDKADIPVADARVSVLDFSIWHDLHWETRADANGRFEWADAPAEKIKLLIEKDGFITQEKIAQAGGDKETKIRFNRTLHLTGKVVDAETKEPVKSFRIEWLPRNDAKDFEQGYRFSTILGSNGVYSLEVGRLYAESWYRGYAHACMFRLHADGYAPALSRVFSAGEGDVGEVAYDLQLKRTQQFGGTVVDGYGHPIAGAQVVLKMPGSRLLLSGQPTFSGSAPGAVRVTDARGSFRLNYESAAQGIIATHEAGFATIGTNNISTNLTIRLEPWGRLAGAVWEYDKLLTNQQIWVSGANGTWPESLRTIFITNSDSQGQFVFNFVPPGKYSVYRMIPMGQGTASGRSEIVNVQAGTTATIKVGGGGRPVVGRFKITNPYVAIDWPGNNNHYYAHSIRPQPPEGLKTQEEFQAWMNQLEIQRAYDAVRNYPLRFASDGAFRIDEVIPGKYQIQIQIYDPRDSSAMAYSKYICDTTKEFEVQPSTDTGPLDLGVIEISLKPDIKKGETAAPDFEATDIADKKFKLSDFRGKYVLLDFWATWCGPCMGEIPYLRQVRGKFSGRKDFVMLSLSLDKTINAPREFSKTNDLPGVQGYLGNWSETKVPEQYGVQGIPAIFLINPEGKIIDSELEGSSMIDRLQKHLK